jgi:hypothetical protein
VSTDASYNMYKKCGTTSALAAKLVKSAVQLMDTITCRILDRNTNYVMQSCCQSDEEVF